MLVWDLIFISCLILALRRIARSWLYPPRAAIVCLIVLCLIVLCLIVLHYPSLSSSGLVLERRGTFRVSYLLYACFSTLLLP